MTLSDLLEPATVRLAAALGLERREARLECRVLMARALGVEPSWLLGHDRDELTTFQAGAIESLLQRRADGEPVAYILGEREFHGHLFRVGPAVLIPRPDTELLVDAALKSNQGDRPLRVLDLGTGSGCIAIALALARPAWEIWALERSEAALAMARDNGQRLGASVQWRQGHWFTGLEAPPFDLIVANPPYVASADPHLGQGDARYEPSAALASGPDGLDDLRLIIDQAPAHLAQGGRLLVEHGYDQGEACRLLFAQRHYRNIATLADLAGHPRVTLGDRP